MVKSQTVSISPAQHASRHVIGGADPLIDPLLLHSDRHKMGGVDELFGYISDTSGSVTFASSPTEKSKSIGTAYEIIKAITLGSSIPGTLSISWRMYRTTGSGTSVYTVVYRNGVLVGTPKNNNTGNTWLAQTDEIAGWSSGDELEIYIKVETDSGVTCKCDTLKVIGDLTYNFGVANDP